MLDISRLLYRGDLWAAAFYLLSSLLLLLLAAMFYFLMDTPGFTYLSIGFTMFSAYCLGKGAFLFVVSRKSYLYFINNSEMSPSMIRKELEVTNRRIDKKRNSRRVYLWTFFLCSLMGIIFLFSAWKSVGLGTCIPIALTGLTEAGIGLMTEFRLREYLRHLNHSRE